ncbi:MAG: hypothetical protein HOE90_20520 [Bacteriovoracaceae bacterium]|jgi:hypothetical protein|nr:hypothetical protein [Bacteriovoracaceae bacterium]
MSYEEDYKFECFEEYFGDAENVKKIINKCRQCGSKMVFNHLPDYKNLLIQESARCMECGEGARKTICTLN